GGPAATPALTRGGRSRDDLGRRPRGGCRGGRSARESTATLPRRESRSGAQLRHDGPPERAQLAGAWTGGLLADRGVNHDETTGGIDHDGLTAHAEKGEQRQLPRADRGLVADT